MSSRRHLSIITRKLLSRLKPGGAKRARIGARKIRSKRKQGKIQPEGYVKCPDRNNVFLCIDAGAADEVKHADKSRFTDGVIVTVGNCPEGIKLTLVNVKSEIKPVNEESGSNTALHTVEAAPNQ